MAITSAQQRSRKIEGSLSRTPGSSILKDFHGVFWLFLLVIAAITVSIYIMLLQSAAASAATTVASNHHDLDTKESQHVRQSPQQPTKSMTETLVLSTKVGDLRIDLRPDLSKESVEYIHSLMGGQCQRCNFYRAEKTGILQGIMAHPNVSIVTVKGSCPAGSESVKNDCPKWDVQCACHGPVMTRGMVGWAAGETGPDFFINSYKRPANWWGTQHTVWGEIKDEESFQVLDQIYALPTHKQGLTLLNEPLHFEMNIQVLS